MQNLGHDGLITEMQVDSQNIFNHTAVTLEIGWLTDSQAKLGHHSLLRPFHNWLGKQSENYPEYTISTAPAELITPGEDGEIPIVSSWLRSLINGQVRNGTTCQQAN